MVQLHLGSKK
ncbi:hypothetical protein FWK35_00024925 [Aphis craccivora]|uniref:Uncharacterized protein n=1 Tax=Aphis craccivora TaxID=307492 RepID=A0A6G0XLT9_APHCR|nr:hypothetical protein FWK35_00024925 [Aphis craccivora]